jgi:hypothetical protein
MYLPDLVLNRKKHHQRRRTLLARQSMPEKALSLYESAVETQVLHVKGYLAHPS